MAGSLEPGRKRQHRQGDDAQETRETAGGSGSFPASAVRDPGAPCWQRLEDTRGARGPSSSTTQLTGSPLPTLPRPSLRAASGQWLGVVEGGGMCKARGLGAGPNARVATGGRKQDRLAQWT